MLSLGWKIAGEDAGNVRRAPFTKLSLKKKKVRGVFLQLREAWRPSVPGKQEYSLQTDTGGQRDGEDALKFG